MRTGIVSARSYILANVIATLVGFALVVSGAWVAWAWRFPGDAFVAVVLAVQGGLLMLDRWPSENDPYFLHLRRKDRMMSETVADDRPASPVRSASEVIATFWACDYLPVTPPPGWSTPVTSRRAVGTWLVTADGGEDLQVQMDIRGQRAPVVRVVILPPEGTTEPTSDARCREILRHLRVAGQWFELLVQPDTPERKVSSMRVWLGADWSLVPKLESGRIDKLPELPETRPLPTMTEELRRHLPEKLPSGWSVPIALRDDDGWMFQTERFLVVVGLRAVREHARLVVSLVADGEEELDRKQAAQVLRRFRYVREWVPEDAGDTPGTHTYSAVPVQPGMAPAREGQPPSSVRN